MVRLSRFTLAYALKISPCSSISCAMNWLEMSCQSDAKLRWQPIRLLVFVVLMLWVPLLVCAQAVEQHAASTVQQDTIVRQNKLQQLKQDITRCINDKLNEPYDTTRNQGYWWRAMKHGKVNFTDSTMGYPKFVEFCYKVYTWGDKTFNSYDSAYVVPTGKNWKLTLKNQNWMDNLSGGDGNDHAMFTSGAASNLGLYLSFMAVSVGYSIDVDRISGAKGTSEMIEFSFTCARFTAEAHKTTNTGRMRARVKLEGGDWRRGSDLDALQRKSMGVSATYFFNNRKYAQAAAYCFSKFQRRSAGSALAGFSINNYDFLIDPEGLTEQQYMEFEKIGVSHVRYTDYCLMGGYAHNWVLNPKLLLNLTALAGTGVKHIHSTSALPSANSGALRMTGKLALTYNFKRYFASFQANVGTSMYFASKQRHFGYTIASLTAVLGIRF